MRACKGSRLSTCHGAPKHEVPTGVKDPYKFISLAPFPPARVCALGGSCSTYPSSSILFGLNHRAFSSFRNHVPEPWKLMPENVVVNHKEIYSSFGFRLYFRLSFFSCYPIQSICFFRFHLNALRFALFLLYITYSRGTIIHFILINTLTIGKFSFGFCNIITFFTLIS